MYSLSKYARMCIGRLTEQPHGGAIMNVPDPMEHTAVGVTARRIELQSRLAAHVSGAPVRTFGIRSPASLRLAQVRVPSGAEWFVDRDGWIYWLSVQPLEDPKPPPTVAAERATERADDGPVAQRLSGDEQYLRLAQCRVEEHDIVDDSL